jgi:hypothetical protein
MRLRIARKVCKQMDTRLYRDTTAHKAVTRVGRTASCRADDAYWAACMRELGPLGRASLSFELAMEDAVNALSHFGEAVTKQRIGGF